MAVALYLDTITLKSTPAEQKIRLAAAAGFAGPRIRGNDVREWQKQGGTTESLADLLRELKVRTPGFVAETETYGWHAGDPAAPALIEALEWTFRTARTLGASIILLPVMSADGTLEETVRNFRAVCERAKSFGLNVGLEFIGHIPKVPDLRTAWRVVEAADQPNGGVVIDFFHFHRGGTMLQDIVEVPAEKILMADLADAMSLPREQLLGYKHRLYPGEGVAGVRDVLIALLRHGFDGPLVVELFNEAYWAADPAVVVATAYRTARAILTAAEAAVA